MSTVIPSTITALAILVFFFMPGLVTIAVINQFKPTTKEEAVLKLLKAFAFSVTYYAFYLIFGWLWVGRVDELVKDWTKLGTWPYWFLVLLVLLLVPLVVGAIYSLFTNWARDGDKFHWLFPKGHDDTAWQAAFWRKKGMFVKLHLKDGVVVGGMYGQLSAVCEDGVNGGIYLQQTYQIDDDERWTLAGNLGGYFLSDDIKFMEFYKGNKDQ